MDAFHPRGWRTTRHERWGERSEPQRQAVFQKNVVVKCALPQATRLLPHPHLNPPLEGEDLHWSCVAHNFCKDAEISDANNSIAASSEDSVIPSPSRGGLGWGWGWRGESASAVGWGERSEPQRQAVFHKNVGVRLRLTPTYRVAPKIEGEGRRFRFLEIGKQA